MTNAVCTSLNKSWVAIHECRLRAISRHKITFNLNATFLYPANDISVRFEVFQKANGYKPWLFNTSVDACRYVRKPFNPFVIMVVNLFREFTNFNHTCPYVGPQIVKGFYLRSNIFPLAIPTGDYLLALTWSFYAKPQFLTNVYFVFKEDL
ncbi:GH22194 [Drosophila grimshawi]|uniref:GH22194 n=1 Tax=Drosophila grimshawi TaxID=7222 RepID=B4K170_DROGR|nr:GH22194 [Drosophila grimshawi]